MKIAAVPAKTSETVCWLAGAKKGKNKGKVGSESS